MPTFNRALAVALTAITLLGCSSLQPLSESQPAAPGAAAAPLPTMELGQDLRLTLASGAQIDLQVLAVKADAIEGVQSGQPTSVALDQVRKIERRSWDVPRTAMLLFTALVLAIVQPFGGSTVVLGLVP